MLLYLQLSSTDLKSIAQILAPIHCVEITQ